MKKTFVVAAILGCAMLAGCGSQSDISARLDKIEQRLSALEGNSETSLNTNTTPVTLSDKYSFAAGKYEVGVDIPAGKYDVLWTSGDGICYVATKEDNWVMHERMADTDDAITEYKNITLELGIIIEISGTLNVDFVSK